MDRKVITTSDRKKYENSKKEQIIIDNELKRLERKWVQAMMAKDTVTADKCATDHSALIKK